VANIPQEVVVKTPIITIAFFIFYLNDGQFVLPFVLFVQLLSTLPNCNDPQLTKVKAITAITNIFFIFYYLIVIYLLIQAPQLLNCFVPVPTFTGEVDAQLANISANIATAIIFFIFNLFLVDDCGIIHSRF